MNRYIVTDDGWVVDRWHAEAHVDGGGARGPATARQWNREDVHYAARRRGVKP